MSQLKDELVSPDCCQMSSSLQFFRLFGRFFKSPAAFFAIFRTFSVAEASGKLSAHVTALCNTAW